MKPQASAAVARKGTRKLPQQAPHDLPLRSSGAIVFAGLCYLFAGFAFSYVDRGRLAFGVFSALWLAWALLGFGAGVLNLRGGQGAGHRLWRGMALVGVVLAVFPGILLYPFARWVCLVLMVVMAARAPQMRTRRDLYLTMTVVFAVCFLTTTHYAADWSLWFYLGPAWLFGALALAWLHAEGVDLSRWTQLSMTTGFVAVSCVIAACLFLFVPRPPVLGFGFLPGGDTPGLYDPPQGNEGAGSGGQRSGQGGNAGNSRGSVDARPGQSRPRQGLPPSPWDRMLDGMRDAGRDPFAPQWQRGAINGALDAAQALRNWLRGSGTSASSSGGAGDAGDPGEPPPPSGGESSANNLLMLLAMALAAWLLWRYRYRWGPRLALAAAWSLSRWFPVRSMQVSARAMTWCLRGRRHLPQPGQSVREHWSSAPGLAPLARQWMERALETYCATRFGGVPATPERALRLREDVLGAADIMGGAAPELAR